MLSLLGKSHYHDYYPRPTGLVDKTVDTAKKLLRSSYIRSRKKRENLMTLSMLIHFFFSNTYGWRTHLSFLRSMLETNIIPEVSITCAIVAGTSIFLLKVPLLGHPSKGRSSIG